MRRRKLKQDSQGSVFSALLRGRIPMVALLQTIAVAEYRSFNRAARALNTSQSSISTRVKTLEAELGILIFERHAYGVCLTDAGRHFVDRITTCLDVLDDAVKTAGLAAQGEHGCLRMGVHGLVQHSFLAELIGAYRHSYPEVNLEITENTVRDALIQLHTSQLDIAFMVGTPILSDYHSRLIWIEPLVVALPDDHSLAERECITWADISEEVFLVRDSGTGPQVLDHIFMRLGRRPGPSILHAAVERGSLLSMVGQGFGITLLGAASSLTPTHGVVFLPIADEPDPVSFSAVWPVGNVTPTVQNMLDLADELRRSGEFICPPA